MKDFKKLMYCCYLKLVAFSFETIQIISILYLMCSLIATSSVFYVYAVNIDHECVTIIDVVLWGNSVACILILLLIVRTKKFWSFFWGEEPEK